MSQNAVPVRVRPVSHAALYWKYWDEQYVVYNSHSGHTHVLDPVAALLVRQIHDEGGCESARLAQHIAALLNLQPAQEFEEKLHRMLLQLDELGLIEVVTP